MKHSRQRDAVLAVLCSTNTHPTADWIYDRVRLEMPNISLGTVYRNLNVLAENNKILKIGMVGEQCRYDGNIRPHNHFVCRGCNGVFDIDIDYDCSINQLAENCTGGSVEYHTLLFYGYCKDCLRNKK